jgi:phage shock protein A
MSIWKRFTRAVRSIFGGAVSSMEDPRLILEQNIRELNDQVPEMNENIATVKANVLMLEKEKRRTEDTVAGLTSKIKAAINADRDDIAQQKALRLEKEQETLEGLTRQLENASAAYEKALRVKKSFMREKENKIQEAKDALRAHERAQWQGKVADTMEQFEVSGLDQTHDEMLHRINEETAHNEARMELALDSVSAEEMQIEEDAEQLRASELVNQFKLEMGKEPSSSGELSEGTREEASAERAEAPPEKAPAAREESASEGEASKTIGRRERSGS